MSKAKGNGDEVPGDDDLTPLDNIFGEAHSEKHVQPRFWRTHKAIERARQARVRARDEREKGKGK